MPKRKPAKTPAPEIIAQQPPPLRLIDRVELCRRIPYSFPIIWGWIRAGTFPACRAMGQKSLWIESEVDEWIAAMPVKKSVHEAKVASAGKRKAKVT